MRGGEEEREEFTLYSLKLIPPGETVEIFKTGRECYLVRRLRDLGLREGALIKVISRDPLAKKMVLEIEGKIWALDEDLCSGVLVRPILARFQELKDRAYYDLLTGCCKREFVEGLLENLIRQKPCALVLMDLDNFKNINDTYGHLCGDFVLKEVGLTLRNRLRRQDLAVRWGGEEFLIYLAKAPLDVALKICERLREGLATLKCLWGGKEIRVTGSFGVCGVPPERPLQELIELIDQALYTAKRAGKNRVVLCEG